MTKFERQPRLPVEMIRVVAGVAEGSSYYGVTGTPPYYATPGAAGADFHAFCPEGPVVIEPGETKAISAGVKLFIKSGSYALLLMPRSGLGKKGIILANSVGLIDSDYQGELGIVLYNRSKVPFEVKNGDRIAQGAFFPVEQAHFIEVARFSQETERGEGGFGSTGMACEIAGA